MSKFKPYAERVNSIAKAAFDAYNEAARKLEKADLVLKNAKIVTPCAYNLTLFMLYA